MKNAILIYSLVIAAAALLLTWFEYHFVVRTFPPQVYIIVVAIAFTVLGAWVGYRLTARRPPAAGFERNVRAIAALGLSEREVEVLALLAEGCSNKEIAERLFVSPHTVKTHVSNLYGKLEVSRRTQAVQKARELAILP
jgi:DNA-binding CsgD family transcriptional regulator